MHRIVRWLSPPDTEKWLGFHDGQEVAEVWPDGMRGNNRAYWRWRLLALEVSGSIASEGDDERARRLAQDDADAAYQAFVSRSPYSN